MKKALKYLPWVIVFIVTCIFISNINTPLQGMHQVRQADTLMTSVLYCMEGAPFLEPRISFRGPLEKGIAIGEFPLFSYLVSMPCKVTGQWYEFIPKIFVYLLFLFGLIIWGQVFFKNEKEKRNLFYLLSLSVAAVWTYLLIPIPDALVYFLFSVAAYLLKRDSSTRLTSLFLTLLSIVCFTLGFIIRPYFVFLLPFLYWRSRDIRYVLSLVPMVIAYIWWYKIVSQSNDLLFYYYTGMPSFSHMWDHWFPSLQTAWYFLLRDQLSFFGIVFVVLAFSKHKIESLYLALVFMLMYFLRGDHLNGHQYYFTGLSIIILFLASEGAAQVASIVKRNLLIVGMLISMIISEQHHWHKPPFDAYKIRNYVAENTKSSERICTRNLGLSLGFYYSLRTGWADIWQNKEIDTFPRPRFASDFVYECPPEAFVVDGYDFRWGE